MSDPLVVMAALDDESFARLDDARRAHFPPERNVVPAHVTLFHALPGGEDAAVTAALRDVCGRRAPFAVPVDGLRRLGTGTAYTLGGSELHALHAELAAAWSAWLTPQDRQRFSPHVVVQNKVPPPLARSLYDLLSATFRPFAIGVTGVTLWTYRGGPWEHRETFPFARAAGAPV